MVVKLKVVLTLGDLLDSLSKIKYHYEIDFNEKNADVKTYLDDLRIRKEKSIDIDLNEVEKDIKNFWKELILKFVNHLLDKIKNRNTKGAEFVNIKLDLEKTEKSIKYDNLDISSLESYYEVVLKDQFESIKEKLSNENYILELYNKGLIYGGIIGFFIGILVGILMYILGL